MDVIKQVIEYYKELFAKGTAGAYIALGALGFVLLVAAIQGYLAYARGTSRSVFRLLFVAASAIAAVFATRLVGNALIPDKTLGSLIPFKAEKLAPLMEASLSEVLLPIIFLVLFLLISYLTVVPHKLICGILGYTHYRNNIATRVCAVPIGLAHGVVTAVALLFPIFAALNLYSGASAAYKAGESTNASASSVYETYLEDTVESPLYEYSMKCGGDLLLGKLANYHK